MKKFFLSLFLAAAVFFTGQCFSQELVSIADEFYTGLADIIEANMDSPQECLGQVINYYQNNQDKIKQIQVYMEEAMKKAAPMMEKLAERYNNMTDEQAEQFDQISTAEDNFKPRASNAGQRYAEVLSEFSQKNPSEGMRIATMAMQLLPKSAMFPQN